MEKTKQVPGTVHYVGQKHVYILGGDGHMYIIEFEKKHLARFRSLNCEPGQLITVLVKNGNSMSNEVLDVVQNFAQQEVEAV